jgi:ferric-dicitrate binding protein FerR (iron transport regulator)
MKNNKEYIEGLILRQLHRDISADEQRELQQWLDADTANREEYAAFVRIWEASPLLLGASGFDTDAALAKVNERLQKGSVAGPDAFPGFGPGTAQSHSWPMSGRIIHGQRWLVAAAACMVVALAGWWLYRTSSHRPQTMIAATDANRNITLPDGSTIWLRKGSTITYPETFGANSERIVELKGEAWFDVKHNAANPFRVKTKLATVEDIGTSFEVQESNASAGNTAAPANPALRLTDAIWQVIVTAGRVKCMAEKPAAGEILVAAGETALLNGNGWAKRLQTDPNYLSWKNHLLEFNQSPLDSVLQDIRDLYGVPVMLSPGLRGKSDKIRVTARFSDNQKLQDVLEEISLTTGLKIKQEKDTMLFFHK